MATLAPSLLSADFSDLAGQMRAVCEGGAGYIHMDVMDGTFVPNITFGQPVIHSLAKKTTMPFDVHLMVQNPERLMADFVTPRTEFIVVHQEACVHLHRTVQQIKALGVRAGVALNPATSLSTLDYILEDLDLVLIMSVNPGFGGQAFIPSTWKKLETLNRMRQERHPDLLIQLDGGVNLDNAADLKQAGVDILVAGAAVFGASDVAERVRDFMKILAEDPAQ